MPVLKIESDVVLETGSVTLPFGAQSVTIRYGPGDLTVSFTGLTADIHSGISGTDISLVIRPVPNGDQVAWAGRVEVGAVTYGVSVFAVGITFDGKVGHVLNYSIRQVQ